MPHSPDRETLRLPFYDRPAHERFPIDRTADIHFLEVLNFLKWIVMSDKLEIAAYFKEMTDQSFFLVAATGLGKTVGVPVHVLLRQMQRCGQQPNRQPRVWVVEPRLPIAIDQCAYMNALWDTFCVKHSRLRKKTKPLFGQITSQGRRQHDAPIQFVTTGIFELFARNGEFDPVDDRVIIDEAHVTVEQNPGVELGIALCRTQSVTVDYMSATVNTDTLQEDLGVASIIRADKARGTIWKTNLLVPIVEVIEELIDETLIRPNPDGRFFPDQSFREARSVIVSATSRGRSHGMLIVVNSYNGSTSDIKKLTDKIRKGHPGLAVLQLASDVIRNPRLLDAFKGGLAALESRNENYVIISTSVVEMGITFPTLDFVVTMDSGYDQETVGDVTFPVVAPLGVNSLLQRVGRVGRRQPGIAYIANEVDAPYSSLEDGALNNGALTYEPIRFPLATSSLMPLAYYCASQEPGDVVAWVEALGLPSKIQGSADRMAYLSEQFDTLELLGIVADGQLTELGVLMRDWIGRVDIAYATELQRQFAAGASREEILFWICVTAMSNDPTVGYKPQYGFFVDYTGSHEELAYVLSPWSETPHEDIAVFSAFCYVAQIFPQFLWNRGNQTSPDTAAFNAWCNWSGLNGRRLLKAAQAVTDAMSLFEKINGKSHRFSELFGNRRAFLPGLIDWRLTNESLMDDTLARRLRTLHDMTEVKLESSDDSGMMFSWTDLKHGHEGAISQDDTPVRLTDGLVYSARIVPSRESRAADIGWRLTAIGAGAPRPAMSESVAKPVVTSAATPAATVTVSKAAPQAESVRSAPEPRRQPSLWQRLFKR